MTLQVTGMPGMAVPTAQELDVAGHVAKRREDANAAAQRILDAGIGGLSSVELGRAAASLAKHTQHMDSTLRARVQRVLSGSRSAALRDQAGRMEAQAKALRAQADRADGEDAA